MIPILWQSGPFVVWTHDVFSLLAVAIGFTIYYRSLRRAGMLESRIITASVAVVVGGVIGARLITAWEHPAFYGSSLAAGAPISWVVEHSGKSILGALAGGYLAGTIAKRALGYRESTADHYAFAIPIATAVGRVGCFLSELPLGTPTSLPWGISVSPAAAANFARCPFCGGPMHPSMLYEIAFNLLAVLVMARWRHRIVTRGDLLRAYLLAAFVFRFFVEFVRGNEVQALGLTGPQIVLIPLTGLAILHFLRQARRGAFRVPAAPAPAPAPAHLALAHPTHRPAHAETRPAFAAANPSSWREP